MKALATACVLFLCAWPALTPCQAAPVGVEVPASDNRDYYQRKAREYAREAESYERKARGYRNDAEEAARRAARYYEDAQYYAKRGDSYRAKQASRNGDNQMEKYDTAMRQAKNADYRAAQYRRQERDALRNANR